MRPEQKIVIATTTLRPDITSHDRLRADLGLRAVEAAREHNFYTVVVDGGSPRSHITDMRERGALVLPQETPGIGKARRQVLKEAKTIAGKDGVVIWMEPEKYTLVPFIKPAAELITKDKKDLVLFQRRSLASYSEEQAMMYEIGALAFECVTGIEADYAFGPMALSYRAVDYVTSYQGEHGDLWDSIHIPRLRMIRDGLPWVNLPIDYVHPADQTASETGRVEFAIKRMEQTANILSALGAELSQVKRA